MQSDQQLISQLGDDVMASALIDRLLHHCHIVNIRGTNTPNGGLLSPAAGSVPKFV